MMRKASFVMLVVALSLGLIAAPAAAQGGEPLKIGVLTDHTGALALYGYELTQGFQLGMEFATDGTGGDPDPGLRQ
jgi:ABC-type branched-subunit amino acid transport system substrate-binding protein